MTLPAHDLRPANPIRRARRPRTLAGAVLALLLAGCAGPGDAGTDRGPTRPVAHAMGTSMVPAEPKRVVVLDTQELDAALSLGVVPVGATRTDVDQALPSFLQGKAAGATPETVGTVGDPSIEAIAALEPDLILSSKLRHERIYPQLAQIAPTVFAERTGDAWKQNLALYADALGRRPEADRMLREYQARAADLGRRVGAAGTSVSVVRFMPDEIRLYGPRSFVGTVLADTGFTPPAVVRDATGISVDVGPEEIGRADADAVFTTTYGPPEATEKGVAGPLFATLPAVRAGRAFEVSDDVWMLAIGLTGANLVLDDIEKHLAG